MENTADKTTMLPLKLTPMSFHLKNYGLDQTNNAIYINPDKIIAFEAIDTRIADSLKKNFGIPADELISGTAVTIEGIDLTNQRDSAIYVQESPQDILEQIYGSF